MWLSRIAGLLIAAIGGAVLAFILTQMLRRSGETAVLFALGIPGVTLLAAAGLILLLFGLHLLAAPRHAIRSWTPRRRA